MRASLPTIRYVLEQGREPGADEPPRPARRAEARRSTRSSPSRSGSRSSLGKPVKFLPDCVGPGGREGLRGAQAGRGRAAREPPLPHRGGGQGQEGGRHARSRPTPRRVKAFRASLTKLGDVYVNDAFGTAHRAHSSITGIALQQRAAGYLMKKELDFLGDAVDNPKRPFVAIIGGAKVSDKIDVIEELLAEGRHAHRRRRHGLHLLQGAGQGDRRLARRGGPGRDGQGAAREGRPEAASCPSTPS